MPAEYRTYRFRLAKCLGFAVTALCIRNATYGRRVNAIDQGFRVKLSSRNLDASLLRSNRHPAVSQDIMRRSAHDVHSMGGRATRLTL
jgi:hypothetical protein